LGEKYSKHLKTSAKEPYHSKQADKPKEPKQVVQVAAPKVKQKKDTVQEVSP
jgi:hypothetical protein